MFSPVNSDMALVYLGLGSNLDNPVAQIHAARVSVAELPGIKEQAFSRLYQSPPMGPSDQPDYVNAVMSIETRLSPFELLHSLQRIESNQGRVRNGQRWGARTIDLDILLFQQQIIHTAELIVPHPGISERAFVLNPLHEIAPDLVIPGKGALADLLANCSSNNGLLPLT